MKNVSFLLQILGNKDLFQEFLKTYVWTKKTHKYKCRNDTGKQHLQNVA